MTCSVSDFVSICDMPRDPGPCRGQLPRWFYDPLDRQCRTFSYSGCQGNENNFVSLQECQQTCMGLAPTAAPTTTTTPAPYTFNPPPATSSRESISSSARLWSLAVDIVIFLNLRVGCFKLGHKPVLNWANNCSGA